MSVIQIDNVNYYVPSSVTDKEHEHRDKEDWVRLWFYKDRKKIEIGKDRLSCDRSITSKLEYKKGVFYKMTQLSGDDDTFDYYFILKDRVTKKDIVKKNSRYKKSIKDEWEKQGRDVSTKSGKITLKFN